MPPAKRARLGSAEHVDAREAQRRRVAELLASSRVDYEGPAARAAEACARDVRAALLAMGDGAPAVSPATPALCAPRPAAAAAAPGGPPADVRVVGSWLARTASRSGAAVDLVAFLPAGALAANGKDALNGRYFVARAAYLAAVREALVSAGFAVAAAAGGDARRPGLVVRRDASQEIPVRVLLGCRPPAALERRLGPTFNNCRGAAGGSDDPTPGYNGALLGDATRERHLALLHGACVAHPSLGDCCVLAKRWLAARGQLGRCDGGVDGFLASMVALHCLRVHGDAPSATGPEERALELFRRVLRFLAAAAWSSSVVALSGEAPDDGWAASAAPVRFVDGASNLARRVSGAAAAEVAADAAACLAALRRDAAPGALDAALTRPAYAVCRYDAFVRVPLEPLDDVGASAYDRALAVAGAAEPEAVGEAPADVVGRRAEATCAEALRGRGLACRRGVAAGDHAVVGVALDPSADATRAALRGPPPGDEKARAFRAFWGDGRCELRRFKDGAVVEAVVWAKKAGEADDWRDALPERSARAALGRHEPRRCGADARAGRGDRAALAAATYDTFGCRRALPPAAAIAADAHRALEALGARLRGAAGPLRVDALSAAAPLLRHTAPFAAGPHPALFGADSADAAAAGVADALDAVARFEPCDAWAKLGVAETRAATLGLLARCAETLEDGGAAVGVVASGRPHLRVLSGGFGFRIFAATPSRKAPDTGLAHVHHGLVRALAAKHRAFGDAVRLVARWAAAQHLSGHASHELLEVLAAAVFAPGASNAFADRVPASANAGFAACLRALAHHDFGAGPVYVDLRAAAAEDAETARPAAARAAAADRTLRVVADYFDEGDAAPTLAAPAAAADDAASPVEPAALHALADAARTTLHRMEAAVAAGDAGFADATWGRSGGALARSAAHATIRLRPDVVARGAARVDDRSAGEAARARGPKAFRLRPAGKTFANLAPKKKARGAAGGGGDAPNVFVGAEPVAAYVGELRATFGDVALFFFDAHEPREISVVFRPSFAESGTTTRAAVLTAAAKLGLGLVADVASRC